MSSWVQVVRAGIPLLVFIACSDSTPWQTVSDGDGDGDIDVEVDPCDDGLVCENAGFGEDYSFSIEAEVVNVSDDSAVLLGADGLPLTVTACGLSLTTALEVGERVTVNHEFIDSSGECWVSHIRVEENVAMIVARCEGEGQITPPLTDLGWTVLIDGDECSGTREGICTTSGGPVRLVIPESTHQLEVTTETGTRGVVPFGQMVTLGDWLVANLESRSTEPVTQGTCFEPGSGAVLLAAVRQ